MGVRETSHYCRERQQKENVRFNANGTVTYNVRRTWHFRQRARRPVADWLLAVMSWLKPVADQMASDWLSCTIDQRPLIGYLPALCGRPTTALQVRSVQREPR